MNALKRTLILGASALHLALVGANAAQAQYPENTIKIVVPFAPGNANDLFARLLADRLPQALGRPVIVENRPGAGGRIGAAYVASAPPDGYTLMMNSTSLLTGQAVYKKPGYDVEREFIPISQIARGAMGVIVRSDFPAKNLQEFVQFGKARPGEINYSSSGVGGIMHLNAVLLGLATGVQMEHIPYGGGAPAVAAVLSKEVHMTLIDVAQVQSHLAQGTLKALAVGSTERLPDLPNVPTMNEGGVKLTATLWYGLFGQRRLPPDVLSKLRSAVAEVVSTSDFQAKLKDLGLQPPTMDVKSFEAEIGENVALWQRIVLEAKIEKQ